jgi:signal peptidase I
MQYIKDSALEQMDSLKLMLKNKRMAAFSFMNLSMIVFSALMMWLGCTVATNSDSPIVVVLSGSMEPAVKRGDILFLNNNQRDLHVGDIVVFKISGEKRKAEALYCCPVPATCSLCRVSLCLFLLIQAARFLSFTE